MSLCQSNENYVGALLYLYHLAYGWMGEIISISVLVLYSFILTRRTNLASILNPEQIRKKHIKIVGAVFGNINGHSIVIFFPWKRNAEINLL